jgi:hypothetical protein
MEDVSYAGIRHIEFLAPNSDIATQVVIAQCINQAECAFSALFPKCQQVCLSRLFWFEFPIAIPPWFIAVRREEIRPPGDHVSVEMLNNDGDAIGFRIDPPVDVWIIDLRKRSVAQSFQFPEAVPQ